MNYLRIHINLIRRSLNRILNQEVYLIRVTKGMRKQHKKFTATIISVKE